MNKIEAVALATRRFGGRCCSNSRRLASGTLLRLRSCPLMTVKCLRAAPASSCPNQRLRRCRGAP